MELIAAMLGAGPSEGGAGQRLASLADVDFHAVMQERTSSHLMEVCPTSFHFTSTPPLPHFLHIYLHHHP